MHYISDHVRPIKLTHHRLKALHQHKITNTKFIVKNVVGQKPVFFCQPSSISHHKIVIIFVTSQFSHNWDIQLKIEGRQGVKVR